MKETRKIEAANRIARDFSATADGLGYQGEERAAFWLRYKAVHLDGVIDKEIAAMVARLCGQES